MTRDQSFERAFVAVRYFLGARSELAAPLGTPSEAAQTLELGLRDEDRKRRAEVLANELGNVVRALEGRAYR